MHKIAERSVHEVQTHYESAKKLLKTLMQIQRKPIIGASPSLSTALA